MRKALFFGQVGVCFAVTLAALAAERTQLQKHTLTCKPGMKCHPALAKLIIFDDGNIETQCTGFLVDSKLVVTNRHCVPQSLLTEGQSCEKRIYMQFAAVDSEPAQTIPCERIVKFSELPRSGKIETQDYAVLELSQKVSRRPFPVQRAGFPPDTTATLWKVDGLVQSTISAEQCLSTSHSLLWPFAKTPVSPTLTFEKCHTDHGNSGSPITNSNGEVVAVLEGISNQKSHDYFKEKLRLGHFDRVQKASNFSCICLPWANECKRPDECSEAHADADLLIEGNRIFQSAIAKVEASLEKRF